MADETRPRRSAGRYVAPLALIATIAGVYLVVHNALDTGTKAPSATVPRPQSSASSTSPSTRTTTVPRKPSVYIVRAGDSLDLISSRTGVPLQTLESLNPGVSPTSLRVGQRLILRR